MAFVFTRYRLLNNFMGMITILLLCAPLLPNVLNAFGSDCRLVNNYFFKCNLLAFCYASRGQRYVLNLQSGMWHA
jgi:hypothetical protein